MGSAPHPSGHGPATTNQPAMPAGGPSSYEEVPYEGCAVFLTAPDHLAALARLFGVFTPDPETCRVLELGCARGENLIPMALAMPRARFLGVDFSPRQVAEGRAAIAELGLTNIELRAQSILDVGPDIGRFDYVLAHGVYSWVPDPVREGLLRLAREAMAPDGLAYISFNTYPGWHMRSMVRELMGFQARGTDGVQARVQAGRAVVEGLARVLARADTPYTRCLREEAEAILRHDEWYLAHEYLEDTNEPVYFHQFVERAAAHGLHYLTDAQYWTMAQAQPAELFHPFGESAGDWLGRQQIDDFIKGRALHHAVLCREGRPCTRTTSARPILSLRITSLIRPSGEGPATDPDTTEDFRNARGESVLSTNDPTIRAALRILDEARPRSVPFETLWSRVEQRLAGSAPPGGPTAGPAGTPERLAEALLGAFAHNLIELHVREPEFTTEVGERPRASPVARRQAAVAAPVANLRHRIVGLVDFDPVVLPHLDGRHDRRALLAKMQGAIEAGAIHLQVRGRRVTDPAEAEPILAHLLEESLRRLAASALLVG